MYIKVKVENIEKFEGVTWVEVVDPIDSLDGGEKAYEGIIDEINGDILSIRLSGCDYLSFDNIMICPKKYEKGRIV